VPIPGPVPEPGSGGEQDQFDPVDDSTGTGFNPGDDPNDTVGDGQSEPEFPSEAENGQTPVSGDQPEPDPNESVAPTPAPEEEGGDRVPDRGGMPDEPIS
jgi:hypothetical protein